MDDFSTDRKEHRRRSNALDNNIMAVLQQLVDQNPQRSMRFLVR
jgi:hypothetical protein